MRAYYLGEEVLVVRRGEKNTRIQYLDGTRKLVDTVQVQFTQTNTATPRATNLLPTGTGVNLTETPTPQNTQRKARELMNKFGLVQWRFELDFAKRRAGCCYGGSRKLITLSYYFVTRNTWEEIIETILHEIAHALDNCKHGHGPEWKAICLQVGCKPVRCYDPVKVDMPKLRFQAVCPSCGQDFQRSRLARGRRWCRKCGSVHGLLTWTDTAFQPA